MSDFPILPTGAFEHVSMDYPRLREEGIRLLGRLAGAQWTDFNTHDPGITILEQLCYAITDLGYRISHPVPELLAGGDPGLPGPEAILTTDPVTPADVRKLALDVDGVGNAWVEEAAEASVDFYHHAGSGELRLRPDPAELDAAPVRLRGLSRIAVQPTEQLPGEAAAAAVAARLHAARGVGSDFEVAPVGTHPVDLRAALEVGSVDDPAALMADIVESIDAYLAPEARFVPLAEARHRGRPLEEILDGPLLRHGFVEALPGRRRTVYVSDLIHAILDVPAVKAVRSLVLRGPSTGERWALEVPAGTVPVLAPGAELLLLRNDLPLRVDPADVRRILDERRTRRARPAAADDLAAPPVRRRDLTSFRSIRYQLPTAYGVGPLGLAASASPEHRARASQLAAYLLIFDQLLANALAQLAHAGELLSPGEETAETGRTYFAASVDDDRLGIGELRVEDPAAHRAWLAGAVEPGAPLERRKRFLAHLLARFAEELGDCSQIAAAQDPAGDPDALLVEDRGAFLRKYPPVSRARGSGSDVTRYGEATAGSGFEERLRLKLGLRNRPGFYVVEHVLLRPLSEDAAQLAGEGEPQIPLLAGVSGPDPWSLQISVVFAEPGGAGGAGPDPAFEQLVAQTIRAEAPAHLSVHLHWLGAADGVDHARAFQEAWEDFRAAYRDYRVTRRDGASMPAELQLRVRDARDRVIDLLGIGRTYPLRDVPLPEQIVVAPGTMASIPLAFSQEGVIYELRDRVTGRPIRDESAEHAPISVIGTGEPIALVTPPIVDNVDYRILAVKQGGAQADERREAWLRTAVRVIEGVDSTLVAAIRLPLLDSRIDNPRPADARLGDFGVAAEVEVIASQEGVTYELVEDAADLDDVAKHRVVSAQPVIGTSGTIVLRTVPIQEDIDLRVRGRKATGSPVNPVVRTAILDLVLPLRVRANPALPAQVSTPVVAHGGTASVRLEQTQRSAEYRVYRGRVRDRDFVFGTAAGAPTIDVPADGRTVRLARPPKPARWEDLPGFVPAGAAAPGTGAARELPIGAPATADTFLLVQAVKRHQTGRLGTGSEEIASAVQLDRALAVLVRPNPAPALRVEAVITGGTTAGPLRVSGGQPGVFYELRRDGTTQPIGRPVYFHQRDDENEQLNKGIDQLAIGIDAVIVRDRLTPAADPRTTPPPAPLLDIAPLPAGTVLRALARRATSGLEAPLDRPLSVEAVTAIDVG